MKENYLASNSNTDESSEATLRSNDSNSVEQKTAELVRATLIMGVRRGSSESIHYDDALKLIESNISSITKRFLLLNSEQNDAVSDTSKAEATTSADNQTSQITDKDWRERFRERFQAEIKTKRLAEVVLLSSSWYEEELETIESELSRLKEENERMREPQLVTVNTGSVFITGNIPKGSPKVFSIEWRGDFKLEISLIKGVYKVTNGVDGWGNNCKEQFKDAKVRVYTELAPPTAK